MSSAKQQPVTMGALRRILDPIRRKVRTMLARGVVHLIDDAGGRQLLQLTILQGEVAPGVEHFQPFGLWSVPMPPDEEGKAEHIVAHLSGSKSHPIALVVSDRRYKPRDEAGGSAGLFCAGTTLVRLNTDGTLEIEATVAKFTGDVEIAGGLKVDGEITVGVAELEVSAHLHDENDSGGPTDGPINP